MAPILCVHGIGQQLKGEEVVANEWRAAMRDGMRLAGAANKDLPSNWDIAISFYSDLFRERASTGKVSTKGFLPPFQLSDIEEGFEADLLRAWLSIAVLQSEPSSKSDQGAETKSGWQSKTAQKLALSLLNYPFFAALSQRLFVGALKQVSLILKMPICHKRCGNDW